MKRNYIGFANAFLDSTIAIVDEHGDVLFAEASERYRRCRRSIGASPELFKRAADLVQRYCDPEAEIVFAFSWSDRAAEWMRQGLGGTARSAEQYVAGLEAWAGRAARRRHFDHHLTHAAAGCYGSDFDGALCAVLDGFGERGSFACFQYSGGRVTAIQQDGHGGWANLGRFYNMVCQACGFGTMSGEEWKVMGLAPYGRHNPELYGLLREMIGVNGLHIAFAPSARLAQLQRKLYALRRQPTQAVIEYADLAHAGQKVFGEVLFEFLTNLHGTGLSDRLVLGGGCALNSSANGKVLANTPFKQLHVFPAPGDDGNAVGAALLAYDEDHPRICPARPSTRLSSARAWLQGKIIGGVQGLAGFGPRALGKRATLADPRRAG